MPNWLADRLVGGDGVEPFGLRLVVVSQEVKQAQGLTRSSHRHGFFGGSRFAGFVPRDFLLELIDELLE